MLEDRLCQADTWQESPGRAHWDETVSYRRCKNRNYNSHKEGKIVLIQSVGNQMSAQNLLRNSMERNLNYLSTGHLLCKTQRRKNLWVFQATSPKPEWVLSQGTASPSSVITEVGMWEQTQGQVTQQLFWRGFTAFLCSGALLQDEFAKNRELHCPFGL